MFGFGSLVAIAAGNISSYLTSLGQSTMYKYLLKSGEVVYSPGILTNEADIALMDSGPEEVVIEDDFISRLSWILSLLVIIVMLREIILRSGIVSPMMIHRLWNTLLGRPPPEGSNGPVHMADGSPEFYEWLAERQLRDFRENPDYRH